MASQAGCLDIEQVAREQPEQILTATVKPIMGLMLYQCRHFAFGLGLNRRAQELTRIMSALYRLVIEKDANACAIVGRGRPTHARVALALSPSAVQMFQPHPR